MADLFQPTTLPCTKAAAVVPNDALDMPMLARRLWIGVSGDLTVLPAGNADGLTVTFKAVPVGLFKACAIRRVLATGTTATTMLALA